MMDAKKLDDLCRARRWGTNSFATLVPHLRCSECGRRGEARVGPARR